MTDKTTQTRTKRKWKPKFDYEVDYNDHFETPLVAYQDILPILDALHHEERPDDENDDDDDVDKKKKTIHRRDHIIYDPYYCDGRTTRYLQQFGFEQIRHEKRDFYIDIEKDEIPFHHTLITNPPYSDTHKEKCLHFCLQQFQMKKRPFFLLMPNYVATKGYYREIFTSLIQQKDIAYYIPSQPYEYDHPEGTGHTIPPFESLWFCGIGYETIERIKDINVAGSFITTLTELETLKAIPTEKRPNPRQRRKKRKIATAHLQSMTTTQQTGKPSSSSSSREKSNSKTVSESVVLGRGPKSMTKKRTPSKQSRHRDEDGKRVTKRF